MIRSSVVWIPTPTLIKMSNNWDMCLNTTLDNNDGVKISVVTLLIFVFTDTHVTRRLYPTTFTLWTLSDIMLKSPPSIWIGGLLVVSCLVV